MTRRCGMSARVPIRRRIAAQRGAARLARAKVDPSRAGLHALVALPAHRSFDGRHGVEMRASSHVSENGTSSIVSSHVD